MDQRLFELSNRLESSLKPEDLFGVEDVVLPSEVIEDHLKGEYDKFKSITTLEYSDLSDIEAASAADSHLDQLYQRAIARVREHLYGLPGYDTPKPFSLSRSFNVGNRTFYVGTLKSEDDTMRVYEGYLEVKDEYLGKVDLLISNSVESSSFLRNELQILNILHETKVPQWKHLPLILNGFLAERKQGVIQRAINGFNLEEVRNNPKHQKGVDQKHMVWMLSRLLSCMGYVHSVGIVHGAIAPSRVVIQPRPHNVILTDWRFAVDRPAVTGQLVTAEQTAFSPPEIHTQQVGPWSDVYSLGKLMIWLLGGKPETNQLPKSVDPRIQDFLLQMVQEDIYRRPSDCWELKTQFEQIKDALWERKYLILDMT